MDVALEHCRHQTKLWLYKPLLLLNCQLKQLYISEKTERFIYRGGCGVHGDCILDEAFK